ncbi:MULTISPECIES: hypothetical protein [unclassified Parafrankia]|uniref:hypothetical protein n=1 Tax=unclassified Parafrankia TaxID=2994368 RepID=UPI000DA4D097|nr:MULTISPECIES: hypothetical protein [unclassified Parafrankia]CAI7980350.1 conserved hypothetical protein [Frankia sp. Hr75.2]SQD94315.1 conserved hypothetical protein [Parafrankia sp. Ea1.12]
MPTAAGPGPSRRAFLAVLPLAGTGGLLLAGMSGCTTSTGGASTSRVTPADVTAAGAAHTRETALIEAYDSAIDQHPGLAETLRAIRAQHAEHARELVAQGLPEAATAAGTTGTPAGASTPSGAGLRSSPAADTPPPAGSDTPETRATTLSALAELERTTAAAHRTGCLAAGAGLAPLLASLCAAESAHAELVAALGAPGAAG